MLPIIVHFILLIFSAWIGFQLADTTNQYFYSFIERHLEIETEGNIWTSFTFWMLNILIRIGFLLIYFAVFKYIILVVLSPILAYMAEKINRILNPQLETLSNSELLSNTLKGIALAIINFLKEIVLTLILMLLTFFFPIIAPFTAPLIIIIHMYYYGYSLVDYFIELKNYNFSKRIKTIRQTRLFNFLIGLSFYFIFLIPFIGWVLAPIICVILAGIGLDYYYKNKTDLI